MLPAEAYSEQSKSAVLQTSENMKDGLSDME